MKLQKLTTPLLTAVLLLVAPTAFSQQWIEMNDSTGLHSYSVQNGDTVLIKFDSAFVLNKRTFNLYRDTYKRVQKGDPATKKLLDDYEALVALQDSMLKAKEAYYQQLKNNFDTLVQASNTFLNKTDVNISFINQSLTNAENQINNIKILLDSSLAKLEQVNKQKWKAAIGGFAVGVGVAAIVFLIAN